MESSKQIQEEKLKLQQLIEDSKNRIKELDTKLTSNYKCKICTKVLKSLKYYEAHIKTHNYIKTCSICSTKFKTNTEYNDHLATNKHGQIGCRCKQIGRDGTRCKAVLCTNEHWRRHNHGKIKREKEVIEPDIELALEPLPHQEWIPIDEDFFTKFIFDEKEPLYNSKSVWNRVYEKAIELGNADIKYNKYDDEIYIGDKAYFELKKDDFISI